ncbi:uncharacterized protein LOC120174872 [Hibiscus syriacus]|uniref:uncharacterized protein LOC120174872 n=1 Tax=Hibiscus syriacus TaxID=106335 RepID=UPI001924BB80|nr:uncharacterized protein LOC120174872 [Hibiscus syriacus]
MINVLSSLLDVAARINVFRFHPKCKKNPLTHICFADDLLLFCHGSLDSVVGVVSFLDKFYEISGLRLNATKTGFFTCGISEDKVELIQRATGFRIGQLPVRYLGVPLVTRKLTSKDCSALLVKIKDKIDKWSNRKLSYGGRLQDVEKLCMKFFWRGSGTSASGARVSWNQVCSPKSEGGLGLRKLADWSKACCLMLIKCILAGEGSLWIVWIKSYCFKSVDYWSVVNGRWIWGSVRERSDKVAWHRLIWFPAHIPKFSLMAWMVLLDKLPTKDRLGRFGIVVNNSLCVLYGVGQKSRNHLFLECPFASEIWCVVLLDCELKHQVLG